MQTKNLDVVYFVRDGLTNEELRYSIRSVCANLPHNRIWIFGGCPKGIVPDVRIRVVQTGRTKWDRVRNMFELACQNKELTDDFILFNDDFFVMQPTDTITPLYRCSLEDHIRILESKWNGRPSEYSKLLRRVYKEFEGFSPLSYELHVPFIFNKKKLLAMLEQYPDLHCARTTYGNIYNVGGEQSKDVKIFSVKTELDYKNLPFLSTDDSIVNVNNDVWRFIRKSFPKKCEYEEY